MPIKFNVQNASLTLDSAYLQAEFGLFRDNQSLIQQLFTRLQPHGLSLQNLKVERGNGSIGDFHVACQLPNLAMTIQVRAEKVQTACIEVPESLVGSIEAAVIASLSAVQAHIPALRYASHTLVVGMHGQLEGRTSKDYLSRMVTNVPSGLGAVIGNGGVLYFGAHEDRVLSTVTFDVSAVVRDGLFFRVYVMWDASRVGIVDLPSRMRAFLLRCTAAFDLEVPTLKA